MRGAERFLRLTSSLTTGESVTLHTSVNQCCVRMVYAKGLISLRTATLTLIVMQLVTVRDRISGLGCMNVLKWEHLMSSVSRHTNVYHHNTAHLLQIRMLNSQNLLRSACLNILKMWVLNLDGNNYLAVTPKTQHLKTTNTMDSTVWVDLLSHKIQMMVGILPNAPKFIRLNLMVKYFGA